MKTTKISLIVMIPSLFWLGGCGEDDTVPAVPEPEPIEVSNFSAAIDEFPLKGQSIGVIEASGGDEDLAFSIVSQTPAGALAIDAISGELTVLDSTLFIYELNEEISADVRVTSGDQSEPATLSITITDVYNLAGDREALIEIFNANADNSLSWDISSNDLADWEGVQLTDGRVTTIQVSSKSITTIPVEALSRLDELERLFAANNNLTSLDLSKNPKLDRMEVFNNSISSIDLSKNNLLTNLLLESNELETLDVSNLALLKDFKAHSNHLTSVNLANGNNNSMTRMHLHNNPNLLCIQVDGNFNGGTSDWVKDGTADYSSSCN